jgi:hypothetical protein
MYKDVYNLFVEGTPANFEEIKNLTTGSGELMTFNMSLGLFCNCLSPDTR